MGYMMFADVWDGFFGLCKGSFSHLGGSAVSFELGAEREKVMSLLFEGISNEMVRDGIYSLALARFAHDTEANNSLILNGFGIRCSSGVFFSPFASLIAAGRYAYGFGIIYISISGVNRFAMITE